MKRYGFRLWFANLLIVVSALTLLILALGQYVPALTDTAASLLAPLAFLGSALAFAFALFEAVFLYRSWKASTRDRK